MIKRLRSIDFSKEESGFTLIELLAVTVLLVILATILYSSITAVLNGRELVSAQKNITLTAEHIFSQLSSDLVARETIPLEKEKPGQSTTTSTPTPTSGFAGFGVRRYMAAKNEKKQSANFDSLRFVTHSLPVTVVSEARNFGLVEVLYRLEEIPRELQLRDSTTRFRLLRQEVPAAVQDSNIRKLHQNTSILADTIIDFNLRYLLQGNWTDQWTGNTGRAFPEAVEVTLGLIDSEGSTHRFRTAIALAKQR